MAHGNTLMVSVIIKLFANIYFGVFHSKSSAVSTSWQLEQMIILGGWKSLQTKVYACSLSSAIS